MKLNLIKKMVLLLPLLLCSCGQTKLEKNNPFWLSNTIYDESVLLIEDETTGDIYGKLMFKPNKIISVKDYSLEKSYAKNVDYIIDGNIIKRIEDSRLPYLKKGTIEGQYLPEPYKLVDEIENIETDCVNIFNATFYTESPLYYSNQILVSYTFDEKEIKKINDVFPECKINKLSNLKTKFENHDTISMVGLGDSVLEGCSSSSKFGHKPFMDDFFDQTASYLSTHYECEIEAHNLSVGGKTSEWGATDTNLSKILELNPDLLFIHFGINDSMNGITGEQYLNNIRKIIDTEKNNNQNSTIILLTPFVVHPRIYDYTLFDDYTSSLMNNLVDENDGILLVDVFKLSKMILNQKKYFDLCANGINHVNDFGHRIYLQSIYATLCDLNN